MKVETISLWDDGSNARYTSYLFEKEESVKLIDSRPAMVVCPGGGYLSTEYREGEPVAMHFLNLGYQVFVLHYHTKSTGGNTLYPQQLLDIAKMMLIIRTHSTEWNIDPNKIGIIGFSAGGHLCSMLSTHWHCDLLKESFQMEDSNIFKPTCALLCYPLTRSHRFENDRIMMPEIPDEIKPMAYLLDVLDDEMRKTLFGTAQPTAQQFAQLDTVVAVDERTVPAFIWTTAKDYMVDMADSVDYARALSRYNIPVELHVFSEGTHGMSKGTKDSASIEREINIDAAQWLPLADRWLAKHMPL